MFKGMKKKEPRRKCDRALSLPVFICDTYIRALLPYDCWSCNGRHHQYVLSRCFIPFDCFFNGGKYKQFV